MQNAKFKIQTLDLRSVFAFCILNLALRRRGRFIHGLIRQPVRFLVELPPDVLERDAPDPSRERHRLFVERLQPGVFTRYSPFICLTSNSESERMWSVAIPLAAAQRNAASNPLYSATLFVASASASFNSTTEPSSRSIRTP
jgi:hypothetical protein